MFLSMSLLKKTRIAEFRGRPDNWGLVVRTITGTRGGFTCVTTIGRGSTTKIAAACDDGTVHIYDSVTGVLKLSLSSPHPVQAIAGHPDGSIIFCTHRKISSITLWDVQTGGLIYTFTLETEARDTAISLNGRYLACGFSDGTVKSWEVSNRAELSVYESGSPIACLCWLAPEEQLMVANEASIHIRGIITGSILVHNFKMQDPVIGVAYSQKFNQLAVATGSGIESSITIIDTKTGTSPASCGFKQRLSCLTFSRSIRELVCGMVPRGLESISVSPCRRTSFDFPAKIASVSVLSNGTVVANVVGSGIQLLNLDEGSAISRQLLPPTLTVHPLDEGSIIVIVPTDRDRITILEADTMSQVHTIPAQKNLPVPTDRTVVVCASLRNKAAVHCFVEEGSEYLQLWRFGDRDPRWTKLTKGGTSVGNFSPAFALLVTFHNADHSICLWSVPDGRPLRQVDGSLAQPPCDITFGSESTFFSHHDTYRIPYSIVPGYPIFRGKRSPERARGRQYCVDDKHEWVVGGSRRICWIPPGYIGSAQASHCWAGSTLVMAGQDGTLRKLTFCET